MNWKISEKKNRKTLKRPSNTLVGNSPNKALYLW